MASWASPVESNLRVMKDQSLSFERAVIWTQHFPTLVSKYSLHKAQAQINNEQYARQNWDEGAQIYLTSETSIPELDGKPLMKTQSRTSKKSSPIEGIIYNVIRKLKVERQYAINSWSDRRVHKWNTKLLHAGSSGLCHLYFYGSIVPRTKLRLICAADESKFIILLLVIILNLSHKESEIGGFPT